jgi:hypothetical protein
VAPLLTVAVTVTRAPGWPVLGPLMMMLGPGSSFRLTVEDVSFTENPQAGEAPEVTFLIHRTAIRY